MLTLLRKLIMEQFGGYPQETRMVSENEQLRCEGKSLDVGTGVAADRAVWWKLRDEGDTQVLVTR